MRKHQQNDYTRTADYLSNEAHLDNVLHQFSYNLRKYAQKKQAVLSYICFIEHHFVCFNSHNEFFL